MYSSLTAVVSAVPFKVAVVVPFFSSLCMTAHVVALVLLYLIIAERRGKKGCAYRKKRGHRSVCPAFLLLCANVRGRCIVCCFLLPRCFRSTCQHSEPEKRSCTSQMYRGQYATPTTGQRDDLLPGQRHSVPIYARI